MNRNKHHYRWCTSCNNSNVEWGYHWKIDHREWKEKQVKNKLVQFSDSATNAVIYCSYPIPLVRSMWRDKAGMGIRVSHLFNSYAPNIPTWYFFSLNIFSVALDLAWEGKILELESENTRSNQCHGKLIFLPPHKPLDHMMDLYEGQKIDLKTRGDIWIWMDEIPVELGSFGMILKLS